MKIISYFWIASHLSNVLQSIRKFPQRFLKYTYLRTKTAFNYHDKSSNCLLYETFRSPIKRRFSAMTINYCDVFILIQQVHSKWDFYRWVLKLIIVSSIKMHRVGTTCNTLHGNLSLWLSIWILTKIFTVFKTLIITFFLVCIRYFEYKIITHMSNSQNVFDAFHTKL